MNNIESIKQEIDEIKSRNKRVEINKAWETSKSRKMLILLLTYIVIVIFFLVSSLPNPFVNALVPALAFLLSTMTIPLFKKWWINKFYK